MKTYDLPFKVVVQDDIFPVLQKMAGPVPIEDWLMGKLGPIVEAAVNATLIGLYEESQSKN